MRKRILFSAVGMLYALGLCGQKTPHPEHLMKYYFTAAEGAIQSVVVPKSLFKGKKSSLTNYFPCFQPEGLRFNQFPSQSQTGYDSIFAIEEMISCGPFAAHRTEITNAEYKDFLKDSQWIRKNLGFEIRQLVPDTSVWAPFAATAERAAVTNPYSWLYFQANTYDNYPVVGISQIQANAYCEWLTDQLTYSPKYANLQAALNKLGLVVEVALPSVAEWMCLYEMSIQQPTVMGVSKGQIDGSYYRSNRKMGGGLFTFIRHQENHQLPVAFAGTKTTRGLNIQNEFSEALLKPLPVKLTPTKPYPNVSHVVGNVAEWTSTPAYGHLYNNKTTILNTNGQLIENAYQQVNVFDFKGYLVDAELLKLHFAVKGGSWAQDFYYLDPMAVFFMQSNHRNNHVGFRSVLHFYPKAD
ncbi:MAG: gliding motility lipoprotein GldJ [Bacteroidota bacterium]|jgi:formylglycine-generating enzyme required for sulfatase activity